MSQFRIPRRQRRSYALAGAVVALAMGGMVLSTATGSLAAGRHIPPRGITPPLETPPLETPPPEAPRSAASPRVELHGPSVDGFFAFTEGAALANGMRDLYAELRLNGLEGALQRTPVALAVVLDRSGSMSGDKIVQAREAVVSLLGRMRDEDRLAVVVYDHDVQVLTELTEVRALRARLPALVRGIEARGGTNIPMGLDSGIAALTRSPDGFIRRVVLISDGQDGSGQSLDVIQARVSSNADHRIVTSSLGIGVDYDERFLSSVADSGRGNYAFLARGAELGAFLERELNEASNTVADQLVAEIDLPSSLHLAQAHGALVETQSNQLRVPLGTLFGGERRKVVLHLNGAVGAPDSLLGATVRVRYRATSDRSLRLIEGGTASVKAVRESAEVDASRDIELHADALNTVIDASQATAMNAWQSGDADEAVAITRRHIGELRAVQRVAPAPSVSRQIEALEQDANAFSSGSASSYEGQVWSRGRRARARSSAGAY